MKGFSPAIALMNRLTYPWKFAIIGLFFILPLSLVMYFLIQEMDGGIQFARKEILGTEYLRPLRQLAEHIAQQRGRLYSQSPLSDADDLAMIRVRIEQDIRLVDTVDRRHGAVLRTTDQWIAIKEKCGVALSDASIISPTDSFQLHTGIIAAVRALMAQAGDQSNLILDPDLDSYYLMETVVTRLPELAEQAGQARARSTRTAAHAPASEIDKLQISNLVGLIGAAQTVLMRNFEVAFRETHDPQLESNLHSLLEKSIVTTNRFNELLSDSTVSDFDQSPEEYWVSGTTAIHATFDLYDQTSANLDRLLEARIQRFTRKKLLVAAVTASCLSITIYLLVAFYLTVMRTVRSLDAASKRMVAGQMSDDDVLLESHDELAQVTRAFAALATRLRRELMESQAERDRASVAEERTRLIIDTSLDAVITINEQGLITVWSRQAETIFGWSREETMGRRLSEIIIPSQYRAAHEAGMKRFMATGEGPILNTRVEINALRRDGQEFPVELTVSCAKSGETHTFSAFIRDITGRKRSERLLAVQHRITRILAESNSLADFTPRILQEICVTLDCEVASLWRVDRAAQILRCIEFWACESVQVPEFETLTRQGTFASGIGLPGRVWANGKPICIVDVTLDPNFPRAPIAAKVGLHGALAFPIKLGTDVLGIMEFFSRRVCEPDEDLMRMMESIGSQVGQFFERIRTEDSLHQSEEQLRQAQKMEAIGRLAGGIAHDFNNLMTAVTGYSDLVLKRLDQTDPLREDVEEIKKAGQRAVALTRQLLAFSRRQMLHPKVLDLNTIVCNMENMLHRLIGENIELLVLRDPALRRVKADPGQIEQVIVNLAVNARDAMPNGGKLIFETANVTLDERCASDRSNVQPGPFVMLTVSDTGTGMDAETQARIFEPFFTTKDQGKGTGLGLSTIYGIVRQSGGHIWVYSELGIGTIFKVYLPAFEQHADLAATAPDTPESRTGSETILLVEDEEMVRTLTRRILESNQYTVLDAPHGAAAMQLAGRHDGPIHLLLTDMIMPGMSGSELAERLRAVRPQIQVLTMSGYTEQFANSQGILDKGLRLIEKPFSEERLLQTVRAVLDGPPHLDTQSRRQTSALVATSTL